MQQPLGVWAQRLGGAARASARGYKEDQASAQDQAVSRKGDAQKEASDWARRGRVTSERRLTVEGYRRKIEERERKKDGWVSLPVQAMFRGPGLTLVVVGGATAECS